MEFEVARRLKELKYWWDAGQIGFGNTILCCPLSCVSKYIIKDGRSRNRKTVLTNSANWGRNRLHFQLFVFASDLFNPCQTLCTVQTQTVIETFWKKKKKNFLLFIFNLKFNLKFRVWSSVQQKEKGRFKPYLSPCQPLEVIAEIRAPLLWHFSVRGATKWDKMKVCIH